MDLFISRFWGFRPETIPLITFGQSVYRDKLLKDANPKDRIVYVATKGKPTIQEEQGRLLGMAEIGMRAVNTLDVVSPEVLPAHNWENGKLKFSSAIPMLRAWRFTDKPLLMDVLDKQLSYNATVAAILLNEEIAARILALPHEEVSLPNVDILHRERLVADRKNLMPSKGIAPVNGERNFVIENRDFGYVYAFRFGKRNVWKIGTSYNPEQRIEQLNCNIPHQETGEKWEYYAKQKFSSQEQAFHIEQQAITELAEYSIGGEMFACDKSIFSDAWTKTVVSFFMSETT